MSIQEQVTNTPVRLAERRIFSDRFKPLYSDGMRLVEEAAAYLDGEGRAEAKKLSRIAATLYAAESMRLTTRLMQIASWLLLQRAANNGEMTRAQVAEEKSKVQLDTPSASRSDPELGRIAGKTSSILSTARCRCRRWCDGWTTVYPKAGATRRAADADSAMRSIDQMTLLARLRSAGADQRPFCFLFVHVFEMM